MGGILEQVIEAPQRSAPVPDGSGRYAIYQEAVHSLSEHATQARTVLLNTQTGHTSSLSSDGTESNFKWVEPGQQIVWQRSNEGKSEIWMSDVADITNRYYVGSVAADAALFQVVELSDGDLGTLLYSSKITDQSTAWPHSTGRVFTSLPCLTFDQGVGRPQYTLYFLRISKSSPDGQSASRYTFEGDLVDVLQGTNLDFFPYSGSMPNISTPNCAISSSGIAFVANEKPWEDLGNLSCETYFVPLPSVDAAFAAPVQLRTGDCNGWSALPVFSRDSRQLAFVRDDDKSAILISRSIIVVQDVQNQSTPRVLRLKDKDGKASHLYPESVQWGPDGKLAYFMACDVGRSRMFSIDPKVDGPAAVRVAPVAGRNGSALSALVRGDGSGPGCCLLMETSLTSPNRLFTLDLANKIQKEIPDQDIPNFGLKSDQVSEIWYESDGRKIHTFIMRPSNFDASKKYPVALVIHGGPIAAWLDAFHLYWTLPVFAEQGYVLVMPNFTGSIGYSREFREAAYGDFGDKPYRDLEACMDYVAAELPYVDIDRAVSLGGSYGGYMNLWIAGQPLAKRFKALLLHAAGGLGNSSFYASDIPGLYTRIMTCIGEEYNPANIERTVGRWDPIPYAENWTTPMLFTHGEKDNRCPTSNSLAAFAHCQIKGVESKLVVFPDESHFILKSENSYHWHREFFEWMDRFTK